MNKQIEEMAYEMTLYKGKMCERIVNNDCLLRFHANAFVDCNFCKLAEHLIVEKGYRKKSEVEKLEEKLFKDVFEGVLFSLVYLGADGKWHTKRNNAEKTTAIIERYLKLVAIEEGSEE